MIPKHPVRTSQETKYFYSYDTFPFVIPILVICDWEINIKGVSGAPKYTKCATRIKIYKVSHKYQNIQSVQWVPNSTKCATSTKIYKVCHDYQNVQSVPQVPKYTKCATSTRHYKVCHKHQNIQSVSRAPKYTKCATSTKIYKVCHEHQNVKCVPRAPKHKQCVTNTKVHETTRVSLFHATLDALMFRPSQPNLNKPELCGEDTKIRNPSCMTFSSTILLCTMGTESLFLGLKLPGSGADHPPPSVSRVEYG
jgi:hypothetical protein